MGPPKSTQPRLTAEAFMAWYDQQPDGRRYELLDGRVVEMQGERLVHSELKGEIYASFRNQIKAKGLPCRALVDGMAVRVEGDTVFEPDVMVRCGPPLPGETTLIEDPVIVVEVVSSSSRRSDALDKLASYFSNPSILHNLIVLPSQKSIIHHQRMPDGRIVMNQARGTGVLRLEPPGVEVDLAEVFGEG